MRIPATNQRAGDIPLLIIRPKHGTGDPPAVVWYHGFGVDKETNRAELERFAAAGFTAIGVDVVGHGERRAADLDQRMAGTQEDALYSVIEFAEATAIELPQLLDYIVETRIAEKQNIAITGISMGAFVVYRALLEKPDVACAVAILGSPEWPAGRSPHNEIPSFCATPLLSINGECDVNVPPAPARRLHDELQRLCPESLHRYVELKGEEHLMSATAWEKTMQETIGWINASHARG